MTHSADVCRHDSPALLTASTVLVNDLDLVVTSPSGRVFLGNGQTADRMNNVEQVRTLTWTLTRLTRTLTRVVG